MTEIANKEIEVSGVEPIHWISRNPDGEGNITACGKEMVWPMRGNGWRVRDITCPNCDRVICDIVHGRLTTPQGSIGENSRD